MDVVYACNDSYVYQTIISMVSLIKHNNDVRLHLFADHITSDHIQRIQDCLQRYDKTVTIINAEDVFRGVLLEQQDRHPRTIYAKLLLTEIIKADRVLYLDSDTIVTGSLAELMRVKMEGFLAAGVLMPYSDKVKAAVGIHRNSPYICDGVVLLNLNLWRLSGLRDTCLDYIRQCEGEPPMQSEGTLNLVCETRIKVLDPQYNLMPSMLMYTGDQIKTLFQASVYYTAEEIQNARGDYKIVHFMNELYNRPWHLPCKHPLKDEYLSIERELFAGKTITKKRLSRHTALTAGAARFLPFALFAALYHMKNRT